MTIELEAEPGIPAAQRTAARQRFELLQRFSREPLDVRAVLRRAPRGRPYQVDAELFYQGRTFAAHVSAPGASAAADEAAERLRRQLRRVVDADVAPRNDARTLQKALAELA